jgi:hypothetical protein
VAAKVAAEMLDAFSSLLGPDASALPKAVFTRCGERLQQCMCGMRSWIHLNTISQLLRPAAVPLSTPCRAYLAVTEITLLQANHRIG